VAQDVKSSIGKRYWRSFLPMWLFPIAFLGTLAMPGFATHSTQYFYLVDFPLMGLCAYPAVRVWRRGGVSFTQMFFWFAIVPMLIWASMIFGIFGLAYFTARVMPSNNRFERARGAHLR
jgi:hypothetical protein